MPPVRVAVIGAGGETGGSIVNGLFEAGGFVRLSLFLCNVFSDFLLGSRGLDPPFISLEASQPGTEAARRGDPACRPQRISRYAR